MLMRPGDKWILTLPSHLGYGERGSGSKIPGGVVLIFELELLDVQESSWKDWLTMRTGFIVLYLCCFLLYNFWNSKSSSKNVAVLKKFSQEFLQGSVKFLFFIIFLLFHNKLLLLNYCFLVRTDV